MMVSLPKYSSGLIEALEVVIIVLIFTLEILLISHLLIGFYYMLEMSAVKRRDMPLTR